MENCNSLRSQLCSSIAPKTSGRPPQWGIRGFSSDDWGNKVGTGERHREILARKKNALTLRNYMQRSFYKQRLLHTETLIGAFTCGNLDTTWLLHRDDACIQRRCYKMAYLHKQTVTLRNMSNKNICRNSCTENL